MRIAVDRVDLYRVRLPLRHEFRTSSHRKHILEHILVRLTTSAGAVGWGECASPSDPYFGPENVDTCWAMLCDYFVPALLRARWETPEQAWAAGRRIRGNAFARAGIDTACWDLWCRLRDRSLASALGATAPAVEAGVSLGIEPTVADLLDQVAARLAEGYRRVKLKIAPGWDLHPVAAVRDRFGAVALQVDANGAYDRADTAHLCRLDEYGLLMIEQPFAPDDLLAAADLQARITTPICLDESIESAATVDTVLRLDAARVVNIKVSRLGGVLPAVAVHDRCRSAGVPVWCGGMHEFGIGRAANIALAALPGFVLPSDISGSDKYYEEDVVDPPIRAEDGLVPVPYDRPGTGHQVVEDLVLKHTTQTRTMTAQEI